MFLNGNVARETPPAKVLVVEDEVLIRAMLAEELRGLGLVVVEAASADEAWTYLTAGGEADLLFSDIKMPGQMTGIELAQRAQARFPELPVILTSGNPGTSKIATATAFLAKPYRLQDAGSLVLASLAPSK